MLWMLKYKIDSIKWDFPGLILGFPISQGYEGVK